MLLTVMPGFRRYTVPTGCERVESRELQESGKQKMITFDEALEAILKTIPVLPAEKALLPDAVGRVLAEDVCARRALPPFDNSAMDGYAVRSADVAGASKDHPASLEVAFEIPAGVTPTKKLASGQAARIFTGAQIPEGADAVVMQEKTDQGKSRVQVFQSAEKDQNIRFRGEDVSEGQVVIEAGTVITPSRLAMAASASRTVLAVHQKPVVAVFTSGDEIIDVGEEVADDKLIDSNSHGVSAMLRELGAIPRRLGIASDNLESATAMVKAGLNADMIISTAGVSVGEYDFVRDAFKAAGATEQLWRIAMKPGKPVAFSLIESKTGSFGSVKPMFGLPGNPVSALLSFEVFVKPAVRKMLGHRNFIPRRFIATLTERVKRIPERLHFVRVTFEHDGANFRATPTGGQGSARLLSLSLATAIIIVPAGSGSLEKGAEVEMIPLCADALMWS
ncbi:MAG: molybdopterin molybdotransferase MoeA [Planctomycetes bacterium]|nr:molybdopterin molybdotransferase MoeA [Planctomycetota bacterium]